MVADIGNISSFVSPTSATTKQSKSSIDDNKNSISSHTNLINDVSRVLSCGVLSGFVIAGMFNPWDRALYLSVKNNRKFLDYRNFENPFAGVFQTLSQRVVSSGLYFPLEDLFRNALLKDVKDSSRYKPLLTLLAGTLAGSTYGLIMNPMSAIKYHYWGKAECGKENFLSTAKSMYYFGGLRLFFVGTSATVLRDLIFGSVFTLLRHDILNRAIPKSQNVSGSTSDKSSKLNTFLIDMISASAATIMSSPFNYVRDMHYSAISENKTKSIFGQLQSLWLESQAQETKLKQLVLLQRKLRLGWGTTRVGCAMAVGSYFYSICSKPCNP